jgi:hypothetical protein
MLPDAITEDMGQFYSVLSGRCVAASWFFSQGLCSEVTAATWVL